MTWSSIRAAAAGQRAEAAELKSLMLAMGESLRGDMNLLKGSVAQLTEALDTAKGRIASLEETASLRADGGIRTSQGLSALNDTLGARVNGLGGPFSAGSPSPRQLPSFSMETWCWDETLACLREAPRPHASS